MVSIFKINCHNNEKKKNIKKLCNGVDNPVAECYTNKNLILYAVETLPHSIL